MASVWSPALALDFVDGLRTIVVNAIESSVAEVKKVIVGRTLRHTLETTKALVVKDFCVYSDEPAAVQHFLDENRIPYDESDRRLRFERERWEEFPAYLFSADDVPFDLTVLPRDALRQAPIDRVDERPMARASLNAVVELLAKG